MPKPRDFLRYPTQFGRADPASWISPERGHESLLQAAQVQHELVREARRQQERMDQKTSETADLIKMNADQLRRIYRGEAGLSIENLFKIARAVGLKPTVSFDQVD